MLNINHYITMFCKGELTDVDAYCLLKCDLNYFYEQCTGNDEEDMTDNEFNEYMCALLNIQTNTKVRILLQKIAAPYQMKLEAEIVEEFTDVEKEFAEFEYRRSTEIYGFN